MHDQPQSSVARPIAWVICILLYFAGDAVSRMVYILPSTNRVLMPVYAWIMLASVAINDAYGLRVWNADDY
jgi:hypothetical protein